MLSTNDVLKDAQRIHEFRGDDAYALSSFLREVETVFTLVQSNPDVKEYIYQRVVLNKLQGEALHILRTLGLNPTWEEVKEALISNFGVRESYHQLFQDAFAARNSNIVNYYNFLRDILCKINEKFEYDKEKPAEFNNVNSEKIILKTFINNIDVNLASVIINRNIVKLREAFNLLEREGLIRNNFNKEGNNNNSHCNSIKRSTILQHNFENQNVHRPVHSPTPFHNFGQHKNNYQNKSNYNNYGTQSRNFSNRTNSNFQENYPQNNNNWYPNRYNNNSSQGAIPKNTFHKTNSTNSRHSNNIQMDVEHFQEGSPNLVQDEVNFHIGAHPNHFQ